MSETKKFITAPLLTCLTVGVVWFATPKSLAKVEGAFAEALPILPVGAERVVKSEPQFFLSARAVLVVNRKTGEVLFQRNSDAPLPIASLTKLMTAIVAINRFGPEEAVTIKPEDLKVPPFKAGLKPYEVMLVQDLLKAMLISSANDASMVLARAAGGSVQQFVEEMNKEAVRLGMQNTHFENPVGFDHPKHYSSAADLAKLVEEFLRYPELLEMTAELSALITSHDGRERHLLETTNRLMLKYPEIVGLKTGTTAEAGGSLIILTADYYSIILGSRNREAETEMIMEWLKYGS